MSGQRDIAQRERKRERGDTCRRHSFSLSLLSYSGCTIRHFSVYHQSHSDIAQYTATTTASNCNDTHTHTYTDRQTHTHSALSSLSYTHSSSLPLLLSASVSHPLSSLILPKHSYVLSLCRMRKAAAAIASRFQPSLSLFLAPLPLIRRPYAHALENSGAVGQLARGDALCHCPAQ